MSENGPESVKPDTVKRPKKRRKIALLIVGVLVAMAVLGGAGGMYVHNTPKMCGMCHLMDDYVASWTGKTVQPMLAGTHAEAGVACIDCHQDPITKSMQEGYLYMTGNYEDPLSERTFPKDFCLSCHMEETKHPDYEALRVATADLEERGLRRNPHDSHWGELDCGMCHKMHNEAQVDYCSSCHAEPTHITPTEGWILPELTGQGPTGGPAGTGGTPSPALPFAPPQ